uniref:Uncharacterized protein n=1 Tax=Tetradesmus obliquus TaxID=3088 RepID=A0A383VY19_TETOB|eukprot:jgi/Sobl393_1/16943/SZX69654.1
MLTAVEALAHAAAAVLRSAARPTAALDNTEAAAGLASATASCAKRAAQLTRAAILLQDQPAAGGTAAAAVYFPGALLWITAVLEDSVAGGLLRASQRVCVAGAASTSSTRSSRASSSSSSSSKLSRSSRQVTASTALLSVVAARSLVQLADAMQAAGPQLLFRCLLHVHHTTAGGRQVRLMLQSL